MVETVIINPGINKIIALSDIHSDIHAFIICLRDCAKVIRKVIDINKKIIPDIYSLDQDTENLLELNLNDNNIENLYKDNLNYEWIGGNTNIVICGDILDGARDNHTMMRVGRNRCNHNNCTNLEYDQVEIKLLRFINEINKLAIQAGGRIYKILGNHDFANLSNNSWFVRNYIPKWTLGVTNYYKEYSRLNYFNAGNPGSDLLLEDGAYICLIINNNIFVHGQLDHTKDLNYYIDTNNKINYKANNNLKPNNIWVNLSYETLNLTSWGRKYDRELAKIYNNHKLQNDKCKSVQNFLNTFYDQIKSYKETYKYTNIDLRVIIGHCPQFMGNKYTQDNIDPVQQRIQTINSTFTNKVIDGNIEILSGP